MTLSLHNFIYGAFDPSAATSIDKPPIDLWLQVVSVKLFGWSSVALKLPEAIAGTAAVPLLYDLVRRIAGPLAALGSAITLTLLPTSVVTARSDTMDSVMMLLLLAIAWLLVRSVQRRDLRLLLAAAVLLGIDFNVKLFEALVPVPAFLVFVWLCWRGERVGVRLRRLAARGAVRRGRAVVDGVRLADAGHDRPYAIGSTNGSVWNSVFVFDGWDRIFKPVAPRSFSTTTASAPVAHAAAVTPPAVLGATTTVNSPPGPFRLFQYSLVGLRDADRDRAVRGDRVRPGGARAAAAPATAAAARRDPRAADRVGGDARRRALAAQRLRAVQLHRTYAAALPRGLHAGGRDRAGCCDTGGGLARPRSVRRVRADRDVRDRDARGRRRDREREARLSGDQRSARCSQCRPPCTCWSRSRVARVRGAGRDGISRSARRSACWARSSPSRRCATSC